MGDIKFGTPYITRTITQCGAEYGAPKETILYYYAVPVTLPEGYFTAKDRSTSKTIWGSKVSTNRDSLLSFGYGDCSYTDRSRLKSDFASMKNDWMEKEKVKYKDLIFSKTMDQLDIAMGAAVVDERFDLYTPMGRDYSYDNLSKASSLALEGYDEIYESGYNKKAAKKLNGAVMIWEETLKEAESDKSVKYDRAVVMGLMDNLSNAYFYLYNPDKALDYAVKARDLHGYLTPQQAAYYDNRINYINSQRMAMRRNKTIIDDIYSMYKYTEDFEVNKWHQKEREVNRVKADYIDYADDLSDY
jgi:hypothetical protein